MNWLGGDFAGTCQAKVRSLAKPVPARLDGGLLHFLSPEYGVAPGQAAVLYDGDRVLGGGWIAATQAADLTDAASGLGYLIIPAIDPQSPLLILFVPKHRNRVVSGTSVSVIVVF